MERDLAASLGTAFAVGLLIGLERQMAIGKAEQHEARLGGVRTFPLIAVAGALSVLLAETLGVWVAAASLLGVVLLMAAHRVGASAPEREGGVTTEVAAVVTWLLGALALSHAILPDLGTRLTTTAGLGVVVTLLLSIKPRLHAAVRRVSDDDIFATLQILVVAVVVLPLLPDKSYGPYDAINPQHIGRMVLFIGAISFTGYLASRVLGPGRGLTVTGLLGGLVSSTAVTFTMARRARTEPDHAAACALAVVSASTMMFLRVLAAAGVVYAPLVPRLLLPLGAMSAVGVALMAVLARRGRTARPEVSAPLGEVPLKNPFELKSALVFGLLFGGVTLAATAARALLGDAAILLAALVAGTTDVDAITLSAATLAKDGLAISLAASAVVVATFANTAVKAGIAFITGGAAFGRRVGLAYLAMAAVGGLTIALQWVVG
ncbi:MAG: MgtC/SapB family protein [Deltaproteobacteria bacterium]|nr:MgtC/SapB family protein [Deltaproteobacteria bacterium]